MAISPQKQVRIVKVRFIYSFLECESSCSSCNNFSYCTTCVGDNYAFEGKCRPECPLTYSPNPLGQCVKCEAQFCDKCDGNKCLQCQSGFYLSNG